MDPDGPCTPRNNSDAPIGISVLHGANVCYGSCVMGHAPIHIREKDGRDKDLLDTASLQPADEESNFVKAHLRAYETIITQPSSQGMTIEELRALILLNILPPSWETFVTTICNASMAMTYTSATGSILSEAALWKSFELNTS